MSLALVELGLGYSDFLELTPFDLAYLYEKHRQREMVVFTLMRDSFANAYVNVRRDKKTKFIPLFDEIEGNNSKEVKVKSPKELRKEREEFFSMVRQLEGGC